MLRKAWYFKKKVRHCFRPYHAMLLLVEENTLLESLPMDSSPALTRIIKVASPLKSLQNLSSDADLPLGQVCNTFVYTER